MQLINLKTLKKKDISKMLEIYNFHIKNGIGNFEEKTHKFREFHNFLNEILSNKLPLVVCKIEELVVGFTYLKQFRSRSGYRFTFENSVYVDKDYMNQGIGSQLLKFLIYKSKKIKKIKNIIAVIGSSSNVASIKLHKKNGFKYIGSLKKVGYKKGKWLDSVYMQKEINAKGK